MVMHPSRQISHIIPIICPLQNKVRFLCNVPVFTPAHTTSWECRAPLTKASRQSGRVLLFRDSHCL